MFKKQHPIQKEEQDAVIDGVKKLRWDIRNSIFSGDGPNGDSMQIDISN